MFDNQAKNTEEVHNDKNDQQHQDTADSNSFKENICVLKLPIKNRQYHGSEGDGSYKTRRSGKHQMAACCSCKKRRKKCDGQYPVCHNCQKLGIDCTMIHPPTGREIKRDYLETLERSVHDLKEKIHMLENNKTNFEDMSQLSSVSSEKISSPPMYPPTVNKDRDLAQDVGYISLGAAGESCYIGETSAYSIAKIISSSINCLSTNISSSKESANPIFIFELPFRFPSLDTSEELLECYRKSVHCQYPFLDWNFIERCFDSVVKEKKNDTIPLFFIFMVFAISSQIQDVARNKISSSYTKSYYLKAFENIEKVIEPVNLYTVQAYLLMAVFSQKMPDGVGCWQTVGMAIRTAVVLGLHRKPYHKKNEPFSTEESLLQDLKSRIFWSAYGIERINGLVLGRPFSISDIDIDAPFPLDNNNEVRIACHVIKLRRIQSSIYTFIYKPIQLVDTPEDLDATRVEIMLELNEWMSTFPYKDNANSTFETNNWSLISYHNSILLLLRPVILGIARSKENAVPRDLEWFKVFTESASAVCINYKNMYLKRKLSYTWLAMHCCFVSGISFLYCIWLDRSLKVLKWKRKSIVYETISACQTILYVLAERWSSATRFRDSFERLSSIVNAYIDSEELNDRLIATHDSSLTSGVFVDGSIGIESYLTGKQFKEKFKHRGSCGESNAFSFTPTEQASDTVIEDNNTCNADHDLDSLWEFLDTTGDKYMRDLFSEMEESIGLNNFV